ncbi:hypothetical protein [Lichenihabitans psoromatis]|uniref:hypothetical protein n=1 Tax=Lichenihabitans psoromatis TaxID=2528642 RepID=UPI0010385794|nr:hypothetical protein [Lichenihabitans psoromatis]
MLKITLAILTLAACTPAHADAAGRADFVPRLIKAIDEYMGAYEVCLVRGIAVYPVAGETPEQIAATSIAACRTANADVKAATKRVHAFPSVSNFMDGTSERIFAFSVRLAKARIASR